MARKLTDTQLVSLCESEIRAASGRSSSELAHERSDAMERYLGEPYGDEVEGRSQVVSREVLDTVEWVMPSLMRIFCDAENLVAFEAVGPEDEEQAQQETDVAHHVFWQQNEGFLNLYTLCKDALLSKTGVLKVEWDPEPHEEREEYRGLNEFELAQLISDPTMEREVEEAEQEEGGYHVVFTAKRKEGRVDITPVPPEEMGVSRDARTPNIKEAPFSFTRTKKSRSDLIEAGYDRKKVDRIPLGDDFDTEEQLVRRHLEDEQNTTGFESTDETARIWITECYVRADRDGDGIAELLKVVMANGNSTQSTGSILLEVEEIDRVPLVAATPIILTHKFYGMSMADLVLDLQRIKTTLLRQQLDNLYLINNQRMGVNQQVNHDDVMTNRPGGLIRTRGDTPPLNNVQPIPTQALPPEAFAMHEYLDEQRQKRTGVGDEVAALDAGALTNVNTGVAALAYDAARSKIELIARVISEICLKPLFRDIHELLQKHSTQPMTVRLRNNWVEAHPGSWRRREDVTVTVGIGRVSQERKVMALSDVMEKQAVIAQGGGLGALVMPEHMHNALTDYTELLGLAADRYWMDPKTAQPQEPGPDYQMLALQVQDKMVGVQQAKVVSEHQKAQMEAQIKREEMDMREREAAVKLQIQQMDGEIKRLQADVDQATVATKAAVEAELKIREAERKEMEMRLDNAQEASRQQIDLYKALLQTGSQLTREQAAVATDGNILGPVSEVESRLTTTIEEMTKQFQATAGALHATIIEMQEEAAKPTQLDRDETGRVVAVNGRPVQRDKQGRLVAIG